MKPLYIRLKKGKIDYTVSDTRGVNYDYDKKGNLLGIEVLYYQELTVNGKKV